MITGGGDIGLGEIGIVKEGLEVINRDEEIGHEGGLDTGMGGDAVEMEAWLLRYK